ncbi:MAG: hypothetical protein JXR64_06230 [Spirochaetales bacterium]|nr:hypothetical protein [Spirochaetales bacterium]
MLKKHIIVLLILFVSTLSYSESDELICTIKYFNKSIYYPNKSIPVRILIQNNSTSPKTFDIADQRSFNVDFIVETLKKERLPHKEKFIIARNTNQPVFVREVRLEPGDEYNFIVDLADYIIIDKPGLFRVTTNFETKINTGLPANTIKSNTIVLNVVNGKDEEIEEVIAAEKIKEVLKKNALSPDKVVEYTINARQKSEWNKFFLYLDVKSLFLNNEDRSRKFKRGTEEEQLVLLSNFQNDIISGKVESGIISVPYSFEITNTSYTASESEVIVYTKFKFPDYIENKKYIYHLNKLDEIWYITSYEVLNLGTE